MASCNNTRSPALKLVLYFASFVAESTHLLEGVAVNQCRPSVSFSFCQTAKRMPFSRTSKAALFFSFSMSLSMNFVHVQPVPKSTFRTYSASGVHEFRLFSIDHYVNDWPDEVRRQKEKARNHKGRFGAFGPSN